MSQRTQLASVDHQTHTLPGDENLIDLAVQRAESLLRASLAGTSRSEKLRQRRLARLLTDDSGRDLLIDLTDQVLRMRNPKRAAMRLRELTRRGIPKSLSVVDRWGLALLGRLAPFVPRLAEWAVNWRIDRDTAHVILPADDRRFTAYVRNRVREGFRINVNLLGEAIIGDREARERCDQVISLINRPDVDYISVKISAVCANLDVLAMDDSLARIDKRLTELFRAARDASPRTFVNLDMEEYRDLELSLTSFMNVLGRDEFNDLSAGIVLQAYIPDSRVALERLIEWSNERYERTGVGVKVRLVKGANLAMERVDSELHGWSPAPYSTKAEVDANFKAMLDYALFVSTPGALRVGVASHNLFDVAWALTLRDALHAQDRIEIEMLEGMAPPQARAVLADAGDLLLYSPIVHASARDASIAYLSRRLDENSSPENFLRCLFDVTPGSDSWLAQANAFRASVLRRHSISKSTQRSQNRLDTTPSHSRETGFTNVADTDFTVPSNRSWLQQSLQSFSDNPRTALAAALTKQHVDEMVARAKLAQADWEATTWVHRRDVLARVADVLHARRGEVLAIQAQRMGKTVREADPEVSEGIDFVHFARHLTIGHENFERAGLSWLPHPVTVVAGPWNFPFAIPLNGVVSAIAAGGTAILKPAPEARAMGELIVSSFEQAGIPDNVVQLACLPDDEVGQHLISHEDVSSVILTGSWETANMFLSWKPDMRLTAETSGKNAMIITAAADLDQAIEDLVKSAFGHAGQKCSAASLAIIEADVYDRPVFHERLADAVSSLRVGSAQDLATLVGPMISAPTGSLLRALTELDPGETWLVKPTLLDDQTWSPGVRANVQPGSWFHQTECFGPILGLMRAESLPHAVHLQNSTPYGLTAGIQTLDPAEVDYWEEHVKSGNAYVNRAMTGAIVQRQPFGGWKQSSVGPGYKPGGPHHLHSYGQWHPGAESGLKTEATFQIVNNYREAWGTYFSRDHDPSALRCESNILRFRTVPMVIARVCGPDASEIPFLREAAHLTGCRLAISDAQSESDQSLAERLNEFPVDSRLRTFVPVDTTVRRAAHASGFAIYDAPLTGVGRIDLLPFVREQSISRTSHRYGRLTGVAAD